MVLSSLIKNIIPIAVVGLGLAFLYNVVAKPAQASASAGALSNTLDAFGSGLGSVGTGAQSFLTGIGTGSAKLLDPLFSLKTLVYGDNTQTISTLENELTASNTTIKDPVVNPSSTQIAVSPNPASQTIGPEIEETKGPFNPLVADRKWYNPGGPKTYGVPLAGSNDPLSADYGGTQQERIADLVRRGYGNDVITQYGGTPIGSLEYIFDTGETPTNPSAINSVGGNSEVLTNAGSSIYQGPIYPSYANPDFPDA